MSDSTPFIVVLISVVILITAAAITLLNREESRYRKLHIAHENLSAWAYSLEECVGQAMITSDAHGRIHGYNTAAQELLGFSIDQVRGHSIFELIPLDGNGKSSRFNPAPDSAGRQVQAVRSDGSSIPVLLKVSQTRLGDQNLFRFLISDLRAAQEQERSQQENHIFRTALDSAGVMVALLSPEGRIIRLSRECADVLEVSPAEAEGNLFWEYFQRRSDWASAQAYFERAKVGALPTRLKATWITRTHRPIPLEWLILKPAWDKNGDLSHILAIAAPAAPRTNEDNQRALRSIEHVAGRLAGHFEDLLSTINGYSELVLHELDPASPLRRDVEQIVTASQRACDTTQQLITFSGQRLTLLEPVDLHAVLGTSPRIAVDADPFLRRRANRARKSGGAGGNASGPQRKRGAWRRRNRPSEARPNRHHRPAHNARWRNGPWRLRESASLARQSDRPGVPGSFVRAIRIVVARHGPRHGVRAGSDLRRRHFGTRNPGDAVGGRNPASSDRKPRHRQPHTSKGKRDFVTPNKKGRGSCSAAFFVNANRN